jgi:tetratricopeptide (TPR) repeat protein
VVELLDQAEAFARQTKWKEAREAYIRALDKPAFNWRTAEAHSDAGCLALQVGVALVQSGDKESHERLCRRLLAADRGTLSPLTADRYSKTCALGWRNLPPDVRLRALELARRAAGQDRRESAPPSWWLCHTAGIAEYYAQNYSRALELLEHAEESDEEAGGKIACKGGAMVFRAMTLKQMGRDEEGRSVLAAAESLLAEPIGARSGAKWWDLDICEIGLSEARELFGQTGRK